jgi:hypothetical protein
MVDVIYCLSQRQKNRSCLQPDWIAQESGKRSGIERFFLFFHLHLMPNTLWLVSHCLSGRLAYAASITIAFAAQSLVAPIPFALLSAFLLILGRAFE